MQNEKLRRTLKTLRASKDLKQRDMAKIIGISYNAYNRKETGHREFTSSEMIKIAEHFGKTLNEIFLPV